MGPTGGVGGDCQAGTGFGEGRVLLYEGSHGPAFLAASRYQDISKGRWAGGLGAGYREAAGIQPAPQSHELLHLQEAA